MRRRCRRGHVGCFLWFGGGPCRRNARAESKIVARLPNFTHGQSENHLSRPLPHTDTVWFCMATQLAIRLPDDVLADLDWLVVRCNYDSRTDAMRDAIVRAISEERRRLVDEQIVQAYTRQPQTPSELAGLESQTFAQAEDDWSDLS